MTSTSLRFLPWARRGLAAAQSTAPSLGAAMPARATVEIELVVAGAEPISQTVRLHGPGDVIGLDPSLIIRRSPAPQAQNTEPNYLAAIDFDPPDLPWTFTPAGATVDDRLRPWLALIVVEAREGVRIGSRPGAQLPVLHIESGAGDEVQSLEDSWAWAHAQVMTPADSNDSNELLLQHSDRNSSRLICPRRLRPDRSYLACLVPAFEAGRQRGLGFEPSDDAESAPAWDDSTDELTLPVYDHWFFATGRAGDFESLASRIEPHRVTAEVGRTKMHVGSVWPGLEIPANSDDRFLDMDGALQSLGTAEPELSDVPQQLAAGIENVIEADPESLDASGDRVAVGPPLYLGRHIELAAINDDSPGWFEELNVDPRARAAAGLGTEVVRTNQEEFVHASWKQVGAVRDANDRLNREALAAQLGRRFFSRNLNGRSASEVVSFASPLAARTPIGAVSLPLAIRSTSLPDASLDPALRRLVSPNSRMVGKAVRRVGLSSRTHLLDRLAAGSERIDPTRFESLGIGEVAGVPKLKRATGGGRSLVALGIALTVPNADADAVVAAIRTQVSAPPVSEVAVKTTRPDLRSVGVITGTHVNAIRMWQSQSNLKETATQPPILELIALAAAKTRSGNGFAISSSASSLEVTTLRVITGGAAAGTIVGSRAVSGRLRASLPRSATSTGRIVTAGRLGDIAHDIQLGRVNAPRTPSAKPDVFVIPGLVKTPRVVDDVASAFLRTVEFTTFAEIAPEKRLVAFDMTAAATIVRARNDPLRIRDRRLAATVKLGGVAVTDFQSKSGARWAVAPGLDRVWAYPRISVAAHERLSDFDPTRLCPGVGSVPSDSVTLLQTNPRFVAAFLAGMNHEMNRELRWRGYPTDRRGTPFDSFWGRIDGSADIQALHTWNSKSTLNDQAGTGAPKIVLLIRGELLHRYPNTLVVLTKESSPGVPSEPPHAPIFAGRFDPDVSFFGFDLELPQLRDKPESWIFSLMEPPGEPRFGLDVTSAIETPSRWSDVAWTHIQAAQTPALEVSDLRATEVPPTPKTAGDVAFALYQAPFAIEVAAADLIPELLTDA